MTQPSASDLKQQQHDQWNQAAAGWRKHDARLRESGAPVTQRLIELAKVRAGSRVLDIACGTGEPAIPAAQIAGPAGHVLATDLAEDMLIVAREKAEAAGVKNVDFRRVDAESLDLEPASFDAVTCRWGLMFMPEPLKCLRLAHRALKSGGVMAAAVWGGPDKNPFFTIPTQVMSAHIEVPPPDPTVPGPFALADRGKLEFLFTQAGFRSTAVEPLEWTFGQFESGYAYWEFVSELAAPVTALFNRIPEGERERVAAQIASKASGGDPEQPVTLSGYSLLVTGTK
jgi:SAM-dependent methyltransferase